MAALTVKLVLLQTKPQCQLTLLHFFLETNCPRMGTLGQVTEVVPGAG